MTAAARAAARQSGIGRGVSRWKFQVDARFRVGPHVRGSLEDDGFAGCVQRVRVGEPHKGQ